MAESSVLLTSVTLGALLVALVAGSFGVGMAVGRRRAVGSRLDDDPEGVQPVLHLLADQIGQLNAAQAVSTCELSEQLRVLATTNHELLETTSSLANTLNNATYRGRWGEVQLRRLVEAAGMTKGVDFVEQLSVAAHSDGVVRPDMVINLTGGRNIVVDAKVPLDAALAAQTATDPDSLGRKHARALAHHVDQLASKRYWSQFDSAPPFVILFLPAESLLGLALEYEPALLERAFDRNVVIATPATLLAMLRTISMTWRDENLLIHAREVRQTAKTLYERLTIMTGHMGKMGASLNATVTAYNKMAASYETRVVVSARRLADIGLMPDLDQYPSLITQTTREIGEPDGRPEPT